MFNDKKAAAVQPNAELYEPTPLDREEVDLREGTVVVFSDCHWLPDDPKSTAHRALLILIKELNPELLIANGDCLDFSAISWHDPIGWERRPSVASEIAVVQKHLGEIAEAAPQAQLYYPQGNHDTRFSARLAKNAQEYGDLPGFDLSHYFRIGNSAGPCGSIYRPAFQRSFSIAWPAGLQRALATSLRRARRSFQDIRTS